MTTQLSPITSQLLSITKAFLTELNAQRASYALHLDASLEKELGIGSIEKAELFSRIEKAFQITLSEAKLRDVKTLRDLSVLIMQAKPAMPKASNEFAEKLAAAQVDPSKAATLIDVLINYAEKEPDRPHIYFQTEDGAEIVFTYGELLEGAKRVASGLQALGLESGDTVAMMLPTCLEFFTAFFGILLVGCVPVPIYPPLHAEEIEEYVKKQAKVLSNAEVRVLIAFARVKIVSNLLKDFIPELKTVTTVGELSDSLPLETLPLLTEKDAALIQYTSGSTGTPKGVLLSHFNLLGNIRAYGERIGVRPTDVVVSWLPLYHDMGLIGAWLGSFYFGVPLVLLSPLTFLTHPEKWLWAIHYHRGTLSACPNFGFELCVRKLGDKELEGLDLSAWRISANGAEAINTNTLDRFYQKFSKYGFKKEALYPAYGLAESTVGLTLPIPGQGYRIDHIDREVFVTQQKAQQVAKDHQPQLQFVSCGLPLPDHDVCIVNENFEKLVDREVGELLFKGPSLMQGYYRNQKATNACMHDGWFATGDYAYIADGEVFITGRKKDMIIKAGRNFYPDDIEIAVGEVYNGRDGTVIAFGVFNDDKGTEEFVIVAETDIEELSEKNEFIQKINKVVFDEIGMTPDAVILTKVNTIPRTSSGKRRRDACKQFYINQSLNKEAKSVKRQLFKLYCSGLVKKLVSALSIMTRFIYTLYCGLIALLCFPIAVLIHLIPCKKGIQKCNQLLAKTIFYLIFNPLKIKGQKNLRKHPSMMYVLSHASYVDFLIAIAVLPANTLFVGKKEIMKMPMISWFMRRAGNITVDRFDFEKGKEDVNQIYDGIKNGHGIGIFPEGTFTHVSGIRPFKMGAFQVASHMNIPVCPISIVGNRRFLRADTWLFRFTRIIISVSEPIIPMGSEWEDVSNLQKLARDMIIAQSNEEALNLMSASIT